MVNLDNIQECIDEIGISMCSLVAQKRRQTLKDVLKAMPNCNEDNLSSIFEKLQPTLYQCLNDKDEPVREIALDILLYSFAHSQKSNKYLDEVVPILIYRLADSKSCEPSEELRLKFVQLLAAFIESYIDSLSIYFEDIVKVLSTTLLDAYANVRRASATCCKLLSRASGAESYNHSYKLVKPILANMKHHQFRTRLIAIEALRDVMREGNWKFIEPQEVFGSLGERLFDTTPPTREGIVTLLGDWFLNLRERYSYFSRMIPLMLTCLTDELPEITENAWRAWDAAGRQYITENEQELKDKMDYLDGKLEHYPEGVRRPNLGCRTLVQRNTCQIAVPLLRELDDWKSEIRVKASHLLVMLILHGEQDITQHVETFLLGMYTHAEKGDPAIVIENVEKAAEYMAYFIPPSTWSGLILPIMEGNVRLGHLRILSALFRGTKHADLGDDADMFIDILSDRLVCTAREPMYQIHVLKCYYALLKNVESLGDAAINKCYRSLTMVAAISSQENILNVAEDCIKLLSTKANLSVEEVMKTNAPDLIAGLKDTCTVWSAVHPDFAVLLYIFRQPASTWASSLDDVTELLKAAVDDQIDINARNQLFLQLTQALGSPEFPEAFEEKQYTEFLRMIIEELITPNLTWRAGRTAEALRTTVIGCLSYILQAHDEGKGCPCTLKLLPHLVTCLRDEAAFTRQLALQCISSTIRQASRQGNFSEDHVNSMYREVISRLDDVSDKVRNNSVDCISTIFTHLPEAYNEVSYRLHLENIIQVILTHLDDPNKDFQLRIFDVLQTISQKAPTVVTDVIAKRRHLFKAQELLDKLVESIRKSAEPDKPESGETKQIMALTS